MKNILIPTDLSQKSLDVVHEVVKKNKNQQVNLYLVHMVRTPTDALELLFLKRNDLYSEVPREFFQSINDLRSTYPNQLGQIRFEFYYGHRAGILHSIIENLEIDEICVPDNHNFLLPLEQSVNMLPLLESCPVPVFKAPVYGKVSLQGNGIMSSILAGHRSHSVVAQ